jgi:hypothetical protein
MKNKKGLADGSVQITDDYYAWSVSTERVCRRAGGSERWKPAGAQDKARLSEERELFFLFYFVRLSSGWYRKIAN